MPNGGASARWCKQFMLQLICCDRRSHSCDGHAPTSPATSPSSYPTTHVRNLIVPSPLLHRALSRLQPVSGVMPGTSARICNELNSNQTKCSSNRRSLRRYKSDENRVRGSPNNHVHRNTYTKGSAAAANATTSALAGGRKLCSPTADHNLVANESLSHNKPVDHESENVDKESCSRLSDRVPVTFTQCIRTIWYQKKGWRPYSRTRKSLPKKRVQKVTDIPEPRDAGDASQSPAGTVTLFSKPAPSDKISDLTVPVLETWEQLVAQSHSNGRPVRLSSRTTRIMKLMQEHDERKKKKKGKE